jgi:ribosomal protein L37AE/L43A
MNLLEIDELVEKFISNHKLGIQTIHFVNLKNKDELSLAANLAELKEELKTGCVTFINKYGTDELSELSPYLFYIVNDFYKKRRPADIVDKKKSQYVCPGCLYLGIENVVYGSNILSCSYCKDNVNNCNSLQLSILHKTFMLHNKSGSKCVDCKRFIPNTLSGKKNITCPYPDCCFVGDVSLLKKMSHPALDVKEETTSILSNNLAPDQLLDSKLELENKIKILNEVIEQQRDAIPYTSSDFTSKHKYLVYQAISNLLSVYPQDMTEYLLDQSRSGGFQHKIFQEYIKLLERSLPFSFKKNKKIYKIESLLDEQLCLFDGISIFESIITDKLEIKNETKETYIGGRKAAYVKPFYIGKLINIFDKSNNESLLSNVTDYTFSKIKLKEVIPGTKVSVSHLRIPPHYQMGGMVYVNRIRKKIVDKSLILINKKDE